MCPILGFKLIPDVVSWTTKNRQHTHHGQHLKNRECNREKKTHYCIRELSLSPWIVLISQMKRVSVYSQFGIMKENLHASPFPGRERVGERDDFEKVWRMPGSYPCGLSRLYQNTVVFLCAPGRHSKEAELLLGLQCKSFDSKAFIERLAKFPGRSKNKWKLSG